MATLTIEQQAVIAEAMGILEGLLVKSDVIAADPSAVKKFCQLQIARLEHEVFGVMFLNNHHQLIEFKTLFRGTINGASVYPREVVKEALALNAAAVILTHNHPSGLVDPSASDKAITRRLVKALGLMDITVLDHIVVGLSSTVSFAERGLL